MTLGPIRRFFLQWCRAYRRYWVRPGPMRAWWDNFSTGAFVDEEWKENFRMCKANFYKLCGELRPFIEKQITVMRSLQSCYMLSWYRVPILSFFFSFISFFISFFLSFHSFFHSIHSFHLILMDSQSTVSINFCTLYWWVTVSTVEAPLRC